MKKVLTCMLCLVMVLLVLAACAEEHQHTFSDQWMTDENEHWHPATCEHGDQVSEKGTHVYEDGQDTCSVCAYKKPHEHKFSTEWTSDETGHWHAADCGHSVKDAEAAHEKDAQGKCKTCGYQVCTHSYSDTLTGDATHHWYAPTCGCEVEGKDKAAHVDENKDGKCDTEGCGMQFCEHTFDANVWDGDEDYHWNVPTCACSNAQPNKGTHADSDGDEKCDVCQKQLAHFHKYDEENWTSDANGHWHAATCEHDVKKDEAAHTGYEEDGVCDVCNYVVFKLYSVNVSLNGTATLLDMAGQPLKNNNIVKENAMFEFQIIVPKGYRLETIANAEVSDPVYDAEGNATYTVVIKVTVDGMNVDIAVSKLSAVDVIAEGSFTAEVPGDGERYYHIVTFTAEAAGEYVIVSYSENFNVGHKDWVYGGWDDNPFYGIFAYTFQAEAGETVELKFYNDGWSERTEDVKYAILQVDKEFALPALKGEGFTVPTQVNVTIHFTLPKTGVYLFTSEISELVWMEGPDDTGYGSYSPMIINAVTEEDLAQTLTFRIRNSERTTYEFDWDVVELAPQGTLNVGQNTVQVSKDYIGYTLTVDKTGLYSFATAEGMSIYQLGSYTWAPDELLFMGIWESDTLELTAGQSIDIYVKLDEYGSITEAFEGSLEVKYVFVPDYDENGNPLLNPNYAWDYELGGSDGGEYVFTAPAGAQLSVDGGATWQNTLTMQLANSATVTILVKNDDGSDALVALDIQKVEYKFDLTVGENAPIMIPGKKYEVTISGGTPWVDGYWETWMYQLVWDADITVTNRYDTPYVSGQDLTSYSEELTVYITYNGDPENGAQKVVISVVDFFAGTEPGPGEGTGETTLVVGTNTVVPGSGMDSVDYTFTATEAGTYTITWTDENAWVGTMIAFGEVSTGYEFTLMAGDTIVFQMSTQSGDGAAFEVTIEAAGGAGEGGMIVGDNAIYVPTWGETTVTFTPAADGTYVIKPAEGESNADFYNDNHDWINWEEYPDGYSFTAAAGTTYTFYVAALDYSEDTIDLVISKQDGESGGTELIIGTTTVLPGSGMDSVDYTFTATEAGTYTINWTDANAWVGTMIAYGEVSTGYEFTLMAGDTIVFQMSTQSGDGAAFEVTIEAAGGAGEGGMIVGDNAIYVPSWGETTVTFTPAADGTYVIKPAAGESNADFYNDNHDWINWEEYPDGYSFTATAGTTYTFYVAALDYSEDTIDLVISKQGGESGGEGGEEDADINELFNGSYVYKADDGSILYELTFTPEYEGYGSLVLVDSFRGDWAELGGTYYWITGNNNSEIYTSEFEPVDTFSVKVKGDNLVLLIGMNEYILTSGNGEGGGEPDEGGLKVGDNSVYVDGEVAETFTAAEAGKYTFAPMAGETNACVIIEQGMITYYMESDPVELTLAAGETVNVIVTTFDYSADTIDFTITFVAEGESGGNSAADIIAEGAGTTVLVPINDYSSNGVYEFEYTATKDGTFVLVSMTSWIYAGPGGVDDYDWGSAFYEFEAVAGETVKLALCETYAWSETDVEWVIFEVKQDVVLPGTSGSGLSIPAQAPVTVTFTVPQKGLYLFYTSLGDMMWILSDGSETDDMQVIEVTEENQTFQITFYYDSLYEGAMVDFDWELRELSAGESVTEGSNTVWVGPNGMYAYTFTADKTGLYTFDIEDWDVDMYAYYDYSGYGALSWNTFWGDEYQMNAGDTITFYTVLDDSDTTEPYTVALEISYTYEPAYDDNGNPYLNPEYTWEFYNSYNDGEYVFSVPAGSQFSIDGGVTWQTELSMDLESYTYLDFSVKNDDGSNSEVLLTVQKIVYEFELTIGENIVQMIPGKEYDVTVIGAVSAADGKYYYQLSWLDENISVVKSISSVASGEEVSSWYAEMTLTITLNGDPENGAQKVVFTVADPNAQTEPEPDPEPGEGGEETNPNVAVLGENHVTMVELYTAVTMTLTADKAGDYVFAPMEGEGNLSITIKYNGSSTYVTTTEKTITVANDGDVITLEIIARDYTLDTVDFTITFQAGSGESGEDNVDITTLLNGTYVHVKDGVTLYEVTVTYSAYSAEFGTGEMTLVDSNSSDVGDYTASYDLMLDGELYVLDAEYYEHDSVALKTVGSDLVLVIDGVEYVLEASSPLSQTEL